MHLWPCHSCSGVCAQPCACTCKCVAEASTHGNSIAKGMEHCFSSYLYCLVVPAHTALRHLVLQLLAPAGEKAGHEEQQLCTRLYTVQIVRFQCVRRVLCAIVHQNCACWYGGAWLGPHDALLCQAKVHTPRLRLPFPPSESRCNAHVGTLAAPVLLALQLSP